MLNLFLRLFNKFLKTPFSVSHAKYFMLMCMALTLSKFSAAQNDFESGINIGIQVGSSKLLGEYNGLSESVVEFNNANGISTSLEISKYFSPHLEGSFGLSFSHLSGNIDDPLTLSAQGYHDAFPLPPNQIVDPLEYNNNLVKPNLFLRYYLLKVTKSSYFNPYLKLGAGYLNYRSELKDTETQEIIYGKGNENYANLSTGVVILGTGFRTNISNQFYVLTSFDLNFVNYDLLDVVHNYDETGNRLDLTGVFSEIRIGIFYSTKPTSGGKKREAKKSKSKGKNIPSSNDYLPFAR